MRKLRRLSPDCLPDPGRRGQIWIETMLTNGKARFFVMPFYMLRFMSGPGGETVYLVESGGQYAKESEERNDIHRREA